MKRKIVVVVGAGFSAALTSGATPLLGGRSLPTLSDLGPTLLDHAESRLHNGNFIGFSEEAATRGLNALRAYFRNGRASQYNFEQFASLMAFRASMFGTAIGERFPEMHGSSPATLKFIIAAIGDFFSKSLSYDGIGKAQRSFHYKVNDHERALEFKAGVTSIVKDYDITFVSFNYDSILEAFLNIDLVTFNRTDPTFYYFPELSHGIPMVLPEYLVRNNDGRNFAHWRNIKKIIKPHGSMHFYRVRPDLRTIIGGPSMAAITPQLDVGFDPNTMQRDIPALDVWQYLEPIPFIVPPVMNKDSYLTSEYFREMLRQTYEAVSDAEHVLVMGFSLPPSDLHVGGLFEAIPWHGKKLTLCYRDPGQDPTEQNWALAAPDADTFVLTDRGIDCSSVESIRDFWDQVKRRLDS